MSDSTPNDPNNNNSNGAPGAPAPNVDPNAAPALRVLAQYLKDHSFENPRAPQSFQDDGVAPAIAVNVDVNARGIAPNQYEVELSVSAQAKRNDDVVFVVDTTYAGAFEILNVPQDQLEAVMLVECPRLLFPFIRQIIADTTTSGNFPPIMLDPIDFFAIYRKRTEQAQQAAPAHA